MPKWEYAQFNWEGAGRGAHRSVMFTHQQNMEKIPVHWESYFEVVRQLGENGWEWCWHTPLDWSTGRGEAYSGSNDSWTKSSISSPSA